VTWDAREELLCENENAVGETVAGGKEDTFLIAGLDVSCERTVCELLSEVVGNCVRLRGTNFCADLILGFEEL
jgi:hypothetical protein